MILLEGGFFYALFHHPDDLFHTQDIIRYGGLLLFFLLIFFEQGVIFFFLIPGDLVLFAAGIFVATGDLEHTIFKTCIVLMTAIISGNFLGYFLGSRFGKKLEMRPDTWYFKKSYILRTEKFFQNNGAVAFIIGLYIGIFRSFIPFVSGLIKYNLPRFIFFTVVGAICWTLPLVLAGYYLGEIPFVRKNFHWISLLIMALFLIPVLIKIFSEIRKQNAIKST
jgi:membrane-associated protein